MLFLCEKQHGYCKETTWLFLCENQALDRVAPCVAFALLMLAFVFSASRSADTDSGPKHIPETLHTKGTCLC